MEAALSPNAHQAHNEHTGCMEPVLALFHQQENSALRRDLQDIYNQITASFIWGKY